MSKKWFENPVVWISVLAVVVFGAIFGVITLTQTWGKSKDEVNTENALKTLNRLYNSLDVKTLPLRKENVDLSAGNLTNSLPDIANYPLQVTQTTPDFIEIFSSPEKAGTSYESWLIDVADKFNQSGVQVDGRPVSVAVRNVSSGLGVDYIASGKYEPDVFAPSTELWGDMLTYLGKKVVLADKSIAGNVAGIVLSRQKHDEIVRNYGSVNSKTVVEAVLGGELVMGYTNPFVSSTGLNFLLTTLYTLDSGNPLSDGAIARLQQFQDNIPYVAYNTMQMKESAMGGSLDGFVLEYQTFANSPDLKTSYVFTPFGVRHDQPVYEVGDLSETKKETLRRFIDFCKTQEMQKLAGDKGFNGLADYISELPAFDGATIAQAQQIWKKEKHGSSELIAVFVADVSGSMDGDRLLRLKESLESAAKTILPETSVGLVTFSDKVNIAVPVAKFDLNQRAYFTGAIKDMRAAGGTAMFDAIIVGAKMLTDAQEQAQSPNSKLMLFVLTDGDTNTGHSLRDVEAMLKALKMPIYTIGYEANVSVLENVSRINEATSINADMEDVVYKMESLFNAQM
ncbi:MAG: VWA domain-containing protein [Gracilibacteraceae bacterium]|jgi:Ca-activated chloride channel family protein|nr:VWA domain-containing protein [Gracilibacteraceae bacterium]